jgi:hypothetical protein
MENAAQADNPALAGYASARRELLEGISALRIERDRLAGTVDRLISTLEEETRRMRELRGRQG